MPASSAATSQSSRALTALALHSFRQYRDGIAEHLVVDPAQAVALTSALHRLAEQRQVEQELAATLPVEIGEVVHRRVVREKQRIAGQVLRVADDGEAASHPRHHKRVLAAMRRADPVVTPVGRHGQNLPASKVTAPRCQFGSHQPKPYIPLKPLITGGMLVQAAGLGLLVAGGGSFAPPSPPPRSSAPASRWSTRR
jgi:hypothetical protein